MGTVVADLGFDWFYLPTYALIGNWGTVNTWYFVIGATLVLLLLPWLPPRFASRARAWSMAVHPDDRIVDVRAGETLLDAGLREGLPMPFECRNGGCGVCKCTLVHGEVRLQAHQDCALSAAERAAGKILLCCAEPLSEIEITYVPLPGAQAQPVKQYVARVTRLELLTPDVMQLDLQLDGGARLAFHAGQYINVLLDDGARRQKHAGTRLSHRLEAHDDSVLGRSQPQRFVPGRTGRAMGTRPPPFSLRAGVVQPRSARCLERSHRPGSRGHPERLS
jgi:ferredoxin